MYRFLCGLIAALTFFSNIGISVFASDETGFELPERQDFNAEQTTEDIEFIINSQSVITIDSQENSAGIVGEEIKQKDEWAKAEIENYIKILNENGMSLNREPINEVTVLMRGSDLESGIDICIEAKDLQVIKDIKKLNIIFGSENEKIAVLGSDIESILQRIGCLRIQIKKHAKTYSVRFFDKDDMLIDKYPVNIEIGLHSTDSGQTVYLYRDNKQENWGGQYDQAETLIEFQTKYSGEYSVASPQIEITDISGLGEYERQAIYFMTVREYFKLGNSSFEPDSYLSRYEFTEALVRMFFAIDNEAVCTFSDVNEKYYRFVAASQQNSIVEGFDDGTFKGDNNVTLEQVLALASRTISEKNGYLYPEQADKYLNFSADNIIHDWAEKEIALSVREGLYEPVMNLKFTEPIKRSDAAVILYRLFMIMNNTPKLSVLEQHSVNTNTVRETMWNETTLFTAVAAAALTDIIFFVFAVYAVKRRKRKFMNCCADKGDAGEI